MKVELQCGDTIAIPEGCKATIKDNDIILERDFHDGDVLVNKGLTYIYRKQEAKEATYYVCTYAEEIRYGKTANNRYAGYINQARLATEEEKQLLFDKMKEQGLKWNAEEKRVEKVRWRAEEGRGYYSIYADIEVYKYFENNDACDNKLYDASNYFHTKEQAEEAAKRIKEVLFKYHKEIGE